MAHERAGKPAQESDLIDVDAVLSAYHDITPDPSNPDQMVVFGTSGHRGSSLDGAFNDAHIAATTQAIVEYRASQGIDGPLFIGKDTHALSMPAWTTAIEVLRANDVEVVAEHDDEWTPTPAVSRAIIVHKPYAQVRDEVSRYDYRSAYCDDLRNVIDLDAIDEAGVHIGADPLGGASVQYWEYIADHLGIDLTVVNPEVDPTWRFMTLDTDGKIRMDCSSPSAMASLIANKDAYDIATGNDADSDRHGIVTPDAGLMNPNAYLAVAIGYLFAHRPGWGLGAGIGKTLVSSSLIDKVAADLGRRLVEVPVGFKWFVPGLTRGNLGFGGEESAGASFLDLDGHTWTTDKDGILLALLASEIRAVTGRSPSEHYADLENRFGKSYYARIDADANREQKARLKALSPDDVSPSLARGSSRFSPRRRAMVLPSVASRSSPRMPGSPPVRPAPRTSTRSTPSPCATPPTWLPCRRRPARSSTRPCKADTVTS